MQLNNSTDDIHLPGKNVPLQKRGSLQCLDYSKRPENNINFLLETSRFDIIGGEILEIKNTS